MAVKTKAKWAFSKAVSVFFEYDTPKIVHIKSKKAGFINRFIQFCVIAYVIGYAIVYKKGYQEFDDVTSAVTSKVKGVVFSDLPNIPSIGRRIWDVADYIVPSQENGVFFVVTNVIITPQQKQGNCTEDPSVPGVNCTLDPNVCQKGKALMLGNGVMTGVCDNDTGICEIYAWCPVEVGSRPSTPVLAGSENFTVFIKNNIEFTKFGVKRQIDEGESIYLSIMGRRWRNILHIHNNTQLQECRYDPVDPIQHLCPIFVLGTIAKLAGVAYEELTPLGGIIEIQIQWQCNLDYDVEDCVPEYEFRRLDSSQYKISRGHNFRYANYYRDGDVAMRDLIKAYGILFVINVVGRAGKFSIVPLMTNIGSGLALLTIATIICDIVVLYVLKAKEFYRDKKYLTVKGADAYEIMQEEGPDPDHLEGSTEARKRVGGGSANQYGDTDIQS